MSAQSVRMLASTFLLDAAWGASFTYLVLEVYEKLGLSGYFAALSINALAGSIGMLTLGILIDSLGFRRALISAFISTTSLFLIYCAAVNVGLLPMSFVLGLLLSYEPIAIAYLGREVEHGEASGIYYTFSRMGSSCGLFLGSLLLGSLRVRGLLILSSLLFLSSLPLLPGGAEKSKERAGFSLRAGFLRLLTPVILMESLIIPLTYNMLEIKLYDSLGRSASLIGSLHSISIMIEIAVGPLMGRIVDMLGGLRSFLCSSVIHLISLSVCAFLHESVLLILLLLLPTNSLYFSSKNKLSVELAGEGSALALSLPASMSSLSDSLLYGILSAIV